MIPFLNEEQVQSTDCHVNVSLCVNIPKCIYHSFFKNLSHHPLHSHSYFPPPQPQSPHCLLMCLVFYQCYCVSSPTVYMSSFGLCHSAWSDGTSFPQVPSVLLTMAVCSLSSWLHNIPSCGCTTASVSSSLWRDRIYIFFKSHDVCTAAEANRKLWKDQWPLHNHPSYSHPQSLALLRA